MTIIEAYRALTHKLGCRWTEDVLNVKDSAFLFRYCKVCGAIQVRQLDGQYKDINGTWRHDWERAVFFAALKAWRSE
jgi:hypothetical protein